jgi:hypothetical protein
MKKIHCALMLVCLAFFACTDDKGNPAAEGSANDTSGVVAPATDREPSKPETEEHIFKDDMPPPAGYVVLGGAKGDLDKDHVEEKVVVFDTNRQTDFGTERELHIFKQKNNGWELWQKAAGPVMASEAGGVMGDPFQDITIENGAIAIYHFGGSRQKWTYTHRFRFQNNAWQLIGATANSGTPCDYFENFDYNLSTGKINYEKTTEDCEKSEENPVTKTEKKDFVVKPKSLPVLNGFHPGENEVKLPNSDVVFYY